MMRLPILLSAICVSLGLFTSSPSIAEQIAISPEKITKREELVKKMTTATLAVLQDQQKSFDQRAENLQKGFKTLVDIDWIAKFVAGAAWRQASDAQRETYVKLYEAFLLKAYVETFGQSKERKIVDMKILGINHANNEKFTARTELKLSNADHLKVDYTVIERADGKNRIIDIAVENVSMLATHRAEFGKIMAAKGMDGVIRTLDQRVNSVMLSMN
ncbi:MAG: ABC transporter substrate-binding protein [Rickettsiales bacterium]|nr:ABC transporter substrate-binding protein [Rickettsiales bacterium]